MRAAVSTVENRPIGDVTEGCFFLFIAVPERGLSSHNQPLRRTMARGVAGVGRRFLGLHRTRILACIDIARNIHRLQLTSLRTYVYATWADAGGKGKGGWQMTAEGCPAPDAASTPFTSPEGTDLLFTHAWSS